MYANIIFMGPGYKRSYKFIRFCIINHMENIVPFDKYKYMEEQNFIMFQDVHGFY